MAGPWRLIALPHRRLCTVRVMNGQLVIAEDGGGVTRLDEFKVAKHTIKAEDKSRGIAAQEVITEITSGVRAWAPPSPGEVRGVVTDDEKEIARLTDMGLIVGEIQKAMSE